MRFPQTLPELEQACRGVLLADKDQVQVQRPEALRGELTDGLARAAVFAPDQGARDRARWLLLAAAWAQGVRTSSIHNLYLARGRGEVPSTFTVPALNLRGPTYDEARAAFRAANRLHVGALLFELARSEVGYTDQRPAEYATAVTAAALREGFQGPLFLQGDHYQFSPSKHAKDPAGEGRSIQGLIEESLAAGYRNIDIDASTLVSLEPHDLKEQQALNGRLTAETCDFVRARQGDVTVSVGGEIGEVGKHNSKPEELEAFLQVFGAHHGNPPGLSKISVNTGSTHGGFVGPDGKVLEVALDFEALQALGEAARRHGAGGVVQHGASTLPEELFGKFPEVGTLEIHLATGFQNLVFDHPALPAELRQRIVELTKTRFADEWKKDRDTEEQFVYKTRKKAMGPLKRELWELPEDVKRRVFGDLEARFALLFEKLRVPDTKRIAATWAIQEPAPPKPLRTVAKDKGMGKHEGE